MRKWIIIATTVTFVAFAALAATNLDTYLNRNKAWLAERVEQALGRDVVFEEIGVSFAGGFGVRVKGVRVADDPRFSTGDVLRAESALVRIRLLPALFGRYEVSRVALEQPLLTVTRTAEGLSIPGSGGGTGGAMSASAPAAALMIAFVDVDGGELRYVDETADPPVRVDLDQIDFTASDVRAGKPLSFELTAAALGATQPNVKIRGSVGPLAGAPADVPLRVDLRARSLSIEQLASVPELAARLPARLEVIGPMSLSTSASGTWGELRFEGKLEAENANVRYGDMLDKPAGVPLIWEFSGTRGAEAIVLESGRLLLHDAVIAAQGTMVTAPEPRYDIALNSGDVSLAGWERLIPGLGALGLEGTLHADLYVQGATAEAPTSIGGDVTLTDVALRNAGVTVIEGLSAAAKLEGDKAKIAPAAFQLWGAPATISGELATGDKPTLTFALRCKELPLDAVAAAGPQDASAGVARTVTLDGALRVVEGAYKLRTNAASASGIVAEVPYQDFSADIRFDHGRAVFAPVSARAFGGTLRGEGVYDTRDASKPSFNFETDLNGIRVSDITRALGAADLVDGAAEANLSLAGSGSDWSSVVTSLVGGGNVTIRKGVLRGINLVDDLLVNLGGLPGLSAMLPPELSAKYPRLFATKDTLFDVLDARISIAEGRMSSDNAAMSAPDFAARARGIVGFDKTVGLSAAVELSEALSKDLIERTALLARVANKASRISVPLRIEGTLPNVRTRPDLERVAHALQRGAVEEFVEGILDRERMRIEHGAAPPPAPPGAAQGTDAKQPGKKPQAQSAPRDGSK